MQLTLDSFRKEAESRSQQRYIETKAENEKLLKEIEVWKKRLTEVERSGGVVTSTAVPKADVTNVSEPIQQSPPKIPEAEKTGAKRKEKAKPSEEKKTEKKAAPAAEEPPVDVGRLDFRVGKIIAVKKHPDADSLYVEDVDIGEAKPRTVVSGLVKYVTIQEMQNRMVVLLCNLKPAKMRGVTSEAMVLCASTPEKVEILIPPAGSSPGDEVHFDGYPRAPDAVLNPKKKIFETVAPDLKTDSSRIATYKGVPFTVPGKGQVTTASLVGVNIK